jgi:small subunit ribosomal protein S20
VKSRLKTLERNFNKAIGEGNKETASTALRNAISALDKAAKKGVIHKAKADRKKSRLSLRLTAA